MYKVGLDIGYGNTKIITEGKKFIFLHWPGQVKNQYGSDAISYGRLYCHD